MSSRDDEKLIINRSSERQRQKQVMLLNEAERFAKEVAARYPDQTLFDSTEIIQRMREERDAQILGLY
jgi:hypothetical protein